MSLTVDQSTEDETALHFEDFIGTESKKQRFQNLANNLTSICWKICIDRSTPRLGTKIEKCLVNCVERFTDTTYFITNT